MPQVFKVLKNLPIIREDFAKVCMDALKNLRVMRQARERLIRKTLDLNLWAVYLKAIDLKMQEFVGA